MTSLCVFFPGVISAPSNITQLRPFKSMTHYYRSSNRRVPGRSYLRYLVICAEPGSAALWTWCGPLSAHRYRTLNPNKLIYDTHLTVSINVFNKESYRGLMDILHASRAAGGHLRVKDKDSGKRCLTVRFSQRLYFLTEPNLK